MTPYNFETINLTSMCVKYTDCYFGKVIYPTKLKPRLKWYDDQILKCVEGISVFVCRSMSYRLTPLGSTTSVGQGSILLTWFNFNPTMDK